MKVCKKCEIEKPLDAFRTHKKNGKEFKAGTCKQCNAAKDIARRKENWDSYLAYSRERNKTAKGMMHNRRNTWKRNGIDPDKAEAYFLAHHGQCDLCGKDTESNGKALAVDHCHETGEIRGMLCSNCNRGIGLLKDDYQLLLKAANYVKRNRDSSYGELQEKFNGKTYADLSARYVTYGGMLAGNHDGSRTDIN